MKAIIPAAGAAMRWGGYYKEMLPIGDKLWLINNAIYTATKVFGADRIEVISSLEKISMHAAHISKHMSHIPVSYRISTPEVDMWRSMRLAQHYPYEDAVLIMPDTAFEVEELPTSNCDLSFGIFRTNMPDRFTVLKDDKLITKDIRLRGTVQNAWGTVIYTAKVQRYWQEREREFGIYKTYDEAFSEAMEEFGHDTFRLRWYRDFAFWSDYVDYIKGIQDD